ncbi:hypothetical protein [Nonomuraea angiospora]|uniref:hypothetical protein n=1 Tax=Nonomuraea angiospora TaxID=46172 RepID=UPI0029AF62BB|nr:hypothetical protein [Nonomuraea angiospora]MDX3100914.1 hypothetical protein [Nonomuraea angiospora]
MTVAPRIALISATPVAMTPAEEAIIAELPEAETWHLLDDRLLADAERAGGVDEKLRDRMEALIGIAVAGGAHAVLLTCSQYGAVAHERRFASDSPVPIFGSDDGAFAEVTELAPRNLLVVASLGSAATDTKRRLGRALTEAGVECTVETRVTATSGHGDGVARLSPLPDDASDTYDAVLLAQYSLAPVARALRAELDIPVISPPTAAATALRKRLTGGTR